MKTDRLIIVSTGGTIDKAYGIGAGVRDLSLGVGPAITGILRKAQGGIDYPLVPLMSKDSLDMNDEDRETIAALCMAVPFNRVLITHGTDTMVETATAIAEKVTDKTIVITGAGQPAVMQGTDADFNVGFALSAALLARPGVYIAINGRLFPWDKCKKNPGTGVFEAL